jgi:hypothetical protein
MSALSMQVKDNQGTWKARQLCRQIRQNCFPLDTTAVPDSNLFDPFHCVTAEAVFLPVPLMLIVFITYLFFLIIFCFVYMLKWKCIMYSKNGARFGLVTLFPGANHVWFEMVRSICMRAGLKDWSYGPIKCFNQRFSGLVNLSLRAQVYK